MFSRFLPRIPFGIIPEIPGFRNYFTDSCWNYFRNPNKITLSILLEYSLEILSKTKVFSRSTQKNYSRNYSRISSWIFYKDFFLNSSIFYRNPFRDFFGGFSSDFCSITNSFQITPRSLGAYFRKMLHESFLKLFQRLLPGCFQEFFYKKFRKNSHRNSFRELSWNLSRKFLNMGFTQYPCGNFSSSFSNTSSRIFCKIPSVSLEISFTVLPGISPKILPRISPGILV